MRLRGTVVLLVEDDLDNLELLTLCLDGEGAEVLAAGSIAAALAVSIGRRVDIVVSDLELPDGDGCALLHQLRKREGYARVPAIAVSGYSQDQWRSQAAMSGFHRFVVKPYPIDALVSAIASLKAGGVDDESAAI